MNIINITVLFTLLCLSSVAIGESTSSGEGFTTSATTSCGEYGDCINISADCNQTCGCDNIYYYNETLNECLLNIEYLKKGFFEKHNTLDFNDLTFEGNLAKKIRLDAERVFNGIIVAVIIFVACSSVCVLAACIYCCHINYSDSKLRNDVKALGTKLKRDGRSKKSQKRYAPIAESCNIMVEDAGVFVV